MNEELRPKIIVTKFSEDAVAKYLDALDNIKELYGSNQPILVQINSYGGSIDGLSMLYNMLKTMENPIVTYTSSKAMSAGAILLSAAGTPGLRYASKEAMVMVHELQTGLGGDIKDVEDDFHYTKSVNVKWMDILAKSMGLKNAEDIRKLIRKESLGLNIWISADKAKKLKIIDQVTNISMEPFRGYAIVKKQ